MQNLAIAQQDILALCTVLAQSKDLKVTVCSSAIGGGVVGASTMAGSLLFGPVGLLVGAGLSGLGAYMHYKGKFKSVYDVIQDLDEDERKVLQEALLKALKHVPAHKIYVYIKDMGSDVEQIIRNTLNDFLKEKRNLQLQD